MDTKSGILFVMVGDHEAPLKVEDIAMVYRYPYVFQISSQVCPPERVAVFQIKLVPGTQPIYKTPYKMAPVEQVELKKQAGGVKEAIGLTSC